MSQLAAMLGRALTGGAGLCQLPARMGQLQPAGAAPSLVLGLPSCLGQLSVPCPDLALHRA